MKNIIHIFGASGTGTTTLGNAICDKLGYTLLDADDYLWLPTDPKFTDKRPVEDRISLMQNDIDKAENVVISGAMFTWGAVFTDKFSLAVRLNVPTEIRVERLEKREYERFGERILPGGDMFEVHKNFMDWTRQYDTGNENMRSSANHDLWQKKMKCPLLTLDGTLPVDALVNEVVKKLNDL